MKKDIASFLNASSLLKYFLQMYVAQASYFASKELYNAINHVLAH